MSDTHPVWNKETILDALVNVVPLGILTFFFALYIAMNPAHWGGFGIVRVIQFAIIGVIGVALTILTYLIAQRI